MEEKEIPMLKNISDRVIYLFIESYFIDIKTYIFTLNETNREKKKSLYREFSSMLNSFKYVLKLKLRNWKCTQQ